MIDAIQGDVITMQQIRNGIVIKQQSSDIRGGLQFVNAQARKTVFDWMMEKNLLDAHYEQYLMAFMEMRAAWLSATCHHGNRIYIDQTDLGQSGYGHDTFDAVYRAVGKKMIGIIVTAASVLATHSQSLYKLDYQQDLRHALDSLVKAMDENRQSRK